MADTTQLEPSPSGMDTLSLRLEDGLIRLVGVLHGDGMGELVQHSLLEGLQSFVVMPATYKLLILGCNQKGYMTVATANHLLPHHNIATSINQNHLKNMLMN